MEVEFDLTKSVAENARNHYEKAKKAKLKIEGAEKSIAETDKKIEALKATGLENAETPKDAVVEPVKRDRKWFDSFRHFTSSDGFLVVGGRDATSNEVIIKKHAQAKDLVFHADVKGAPFFVVKNTGDATVPENTLLEAAQAAASYSSGWKHGIGACDVYMVEPAQLSKTPESGEYLTKGAFVVRGQRRWFRNTQLMVAVGFEKNEGVLGGPETAVTAKTGCFVEILPGGLKPAELAREAKKALLRKAGKEAGPLLKQIPLDEFQKVLPAGGGNIAG